VIHAVIADVGGVQQSASRDDFGQTRNVPSVRLSQNYVVKLLFSNIVFVFHMVRSVELLPISWTAG
jgi:hypothetical protein